MTNDKPELNPADFNYRTRITKVRGGWTKEKLKKELRHKKGTRSDSFFNKEICRYDNPKDFEDNLFYHGSGRHISDLKPSISLTNTNDFGGGSGEKYYAISLSKSREMASNFTGASNSGNVAPVILKRNAIVKKMPELKDANYLDDIITELWEEGVDAVLIGDHSSKHGEQELAILNPACIIVGKPEYFQVLNKKKMPSFDSDKIEEIWLNASNEYRKISEENWEQSNENFKQKYGRDRDCPKWSSRQQSVVDYHDYHIKKFMDSKQKPDSSPIVEDFLRKAEEKTTKKIERPKQKR
jgi:hypothetical protein